MFVTKLLIRVMYILARYNIALQYIYLYLVDLTNLRVRSCGNNKRCV